MATAMAVVMALLMATRMEVAKMSENQLWFYFWIIAGIVVICTTYIGCGYSLQERKLFVEGGYVECMLPGSTTTKWCK